MNLFKRSNTCSPSPQGSQVSSDTSSNVPGLTSRSLESTDKSKKFRFDLVKPVREPFRANFLILLLKLIVAGGLLGALIVGYALGFKVLDLGFFSVGLYGTVLICDFLVQFTCAILNRLSINKIANNAKKHNERVLNELQEKETLPSDLTEPNIDQERRLTSRTLCPNGDISIAVVGYREDDDAWRACLRSLQKQTLCPKTLIAVVDGEDQDDLEMARAFQEEFKSRRAKVIHLPLLLSKLHQTTYKDLVGQSLKKQSRISAFLQWLMARKSEDRMHALEEAEKAVIDQVNDWNVQYRIDQYDAVCFTQPHGHKRTAMFTAFAVALYACKTKEAVFTTDSDTLLQNNALDEMLVVMRSSNEIGGVTADVRIWNRNKSLLARMCSVRYWMAFNIERACQSWWGCVGCISGPMGLYRACDLHDILGLWNLQRFGGKDTTFGDDRHLTNQILAKGLRTRYTHRTYCESESPTTFVRWVKQQTRWSKSFFREAFWFPASFAYQSWWMLVETTKQALYPFILVATVFHFLFHPADSFRPVAWLATMFGIALIKSLVAVWISRDPWMLCFSGYGFIYFFGLLPSKLYALTTMTQTGWGTSARSSGEMKRGDSFLQRSFHVGHLAFWFVCLAAGLGYFFAQAFDNWWFLLIATVSLPPSVLLYVEIPNFGRSEQGIVQFKKQSVYHHETHSKAFNVPESNESVIAIPIPALIRESTT